MSRHYARKIDVIRRYVLLDNGLIMQYTGNTFVNSEGDVCMMYGEHVGSMVIQCSGEIIDTSDDRKKLERKLKRIRRLETAG